MKLLEFAVGASLLAVASAALAAEESPWWQGAKIGVMGTYLGPSGVREASSEAAGVSVFLGLPLKNYDGWSAQLSWVWNELERDDQTGIDALQQLGVDVLRHFRPDSSLKPFVVTGLAAAYEDIAGEHATRPAVGLGGGFDWQPASAPLSLRLEARAVVQENDYELNGRATSGRTLMFDGRFGLGALWVFGAAVSVSVADSDRDGVADEADLCPDSLPNTDIDRTGCESLAVKDSDEDGVSNARDLCPGTPLGDQVDEVGCGDQAAVVLKGVNFALNSDQLTVEATEILDSAAQLLGSALLGIRIEIAGHTDSSGGADYNQALSARRAYAVKQYLVDQGIDADRLVSTGYGADRPVADNATELGRSKNRRVLFRVLD